MLDLEPNNFVVSTLVYQGMNKFQMRRMYNDQKLLVSIF